MKEELKTRCWFRDEGMMWGMIKSVVYPNTGVVSRHGKRSPVVFPRHSWGICCRSLLTGLDLLDSWVRKENAARVETGIPFIHYESRVFHFPLLFAVCPSLLQITYYVLRISCKNRRWKSTSKSKWMSKHVSSAVLVCHQSRVTRVHHSIEIDSNIRMTHFSCELSKF